ncbi:hypothetical protein [Pseudodesulfovibrio pelocollis]|uniref:hypothetical protein n=1 Tax=Pseudodesulfovibrio pelocollis TaxID=3051432 RepID=UPI00255AE79E|nr:hypothetical protein [Pseudodesulfovibrio sp. SB368]
MISDDAIRAEIAGAFQPFELFMPAPACIETSTLHWANVSPRNISTNRQDIRLNRVRRILDYYAANGRLQGQN